ncbi:hypothetical protein GJ744_008154 [Endocarpon pusillum]|uniref:Agd3 deacetylase domain-containing protein n=1 Tax=Endocarpon pusillum TaxID=364733 RepID=A0A8H7E5I0_9EURO|nr:hypothetical protein GJ744_008154 [Endocarpon pusillum]
MDDVADFTVAKWINASGGSGDFNFLLYFSKIKEEKRTSHHVHQANMREGDVLSFTFGSTIGSLSLQIWIVAILQEMMRFTTWPVVTIKHGDLVVAFINRMAHDASPISHGRFPAIRNPSPALP